MSSIQMVDRGIYILVLLEEHLYKPLFDQIVSIS